jgi:glutathione S-transferase
VNNAASIVNGTPYERELVQTICRMKNLSCTPIPNPKHQNPLNLIYRDTVLEGLTTIIYFLDEKYPIPEMLIGEPETRATLLMLASTIQRSPDQLHQLLLTTNGADHYLLGRELSLADALLVPVIDDIPGLRYKNSLIEALQWNESSSSASSRSF